MKNISYELKNSILNGIISNCILVELENGSYHGFTDHNESITTLGFTFNPAPGLQKIKMNNSTGSSISNTELGSAWVDIPEDDLKAGKFDNAKVSLYWVNWEHPEYGGYLSYSGKIGSISWSESGFIADIVSHMKDLEKLFSLSFTANCRHDLFSTSVTPGIAGYCGINKLLHTFQGTITHINVPYYSFEVSGSCLGKAANYFAFGEIKVTSGINEGAILPIKNIVDTTLAFSLPTPYDFAIGDTFTISGGCDKTAATCKAKFNNILNFGGFPHIKPQVNFK